MRAFLLQFQLVYCIGIIEYQFALGRLRIIEKNSLYLRGCDEFFIQKKNRFLLFFIEKYTEALPVCTRCG